MTAERRTAQPIGRIRAASLTDRSDRVDIVIADGRVRALEAAVDDAGRVERRPVLAGDPPPPPAGLAVDGRAVLPAFVDAHVHLDKAYQLAPAHALHAETSADPAPTDVDGVIELMGRLRSSPHALDVAIGARRAVDRLVRHGTTAARVHVEIDPAVGLDLVVLQQQIAAAEADRIQLQLVAFPQRGLELGGMPALLEEALAMGVDVVGGCPYVDDDPGWHLDQVFALAERHRKPVDLHLDFSDDPAGSLIGLVAERTRALGMQGQVTIGHVTTLAAMDPDARREALDVLADAGIALVVMPATDLHLTGHGHPGRRSVAPFDEAAAAGVRVAIANNNIANPFAPFGNASPLQAAWLAGVIRRAADPVGAAVLLDAITSSPAAILGLDAHGPMVGAEAHLVVLDTLDAGAALLDAPTVLATLRAGCLVDLLVGVASVPHG